MTRVRTALLAPICVAGLALAGCGEAKPQPAEIPPAAPTVAAAAGPGLLTGMPEYLTPSNVYAAAGANMFSPAVQDHK